MKKYLITSALPYANGPIHFGHIAGAYLPADITYRHRKLKGDKVIHISGSDEHGVAIMMNAQKAGKSYQEYVDHWHQEHRDVFASYDIHFDYFGQTSADYHREEVLCWFEKLHAAGAIEQRAEDQLQCQDCKNYLPDRFVEGKCYVCGYAKARGDECPACGTWIEPTKLIEPICQFCSSQNIKVVSNDQWYLVLSKYHEVFRKWFAQKKDWRKTVIPFVDSLSKENLHDRAITRDLDWGIDVPLEQAKGKKLYVWFDAPIGYVSNTKAYLKNINSSEDYLKDWWNHPDTEITNFIGKDNIIFHAIIFPVMCMGTGFAKPVDHLPANQYVNLDGRQFSKSQGWYVDAKQAVEDFGSDALRYYLASIIPEAHDSSFTWQGFEAKVNNELANNIGNFVNRCLKFSAKNWPEGIDQKKFESLKTHPVYQEIQKSFVQIQEQLDQVQIKRALELVMNLGQKANTFFSDQEPWAVYKTDPEKASEIIANSSAIIIYLAVALRPFLPKLSSAMLEYFDFIDHKLISALYQGNLDTLFTTMPGKIKLAKDPQGLVAKILPETIAKMEQALKGNHE